MIRMVIYIFLLAAVAMFYKTFYYDYQKKEISAEENVSIETSEATQPVAQPAQTVEVPKNNRADEQNRTGWQSRKGMPIDRLGDTIGESLKDKIQVK